MCAQQDLSLYSTLRLARRQTYVSVSPSLAGVKHVKSHVSDCVQQLASIMGGREGGESLLYCSCVLDLVGVLCALFHFFPAALCLIGHLFLACMVWVYTRTRLVTASHAMPLAPLPISPNPQEKQKKRARTAEVEKERLEKLARCDDSSLAHPVNTPVFDLGSLDLLL